MKFSLKSTAILSALAVLIASPFAMAGSASAQPVPARGMTGSYLGGGVAGGVSTADGNDTTVGGNIQARFNDNRTPISLRAAALVGGDGAAVMPMVTYDAPIARNTNLYAGAGYSIVTDEGSASPLGDKNSVVLTAGVETAVQQNVALYGDVKLGLDAFENSNDPAVGVQLGAAYRF